jgi:tRNA G18 (ribose-2'-O)-methylase SpoU
LVIGNEERGISDEVLGLLDASVHIPMHGVKTSLNVAMATGIVTYALLEKWLAH